MCVCACENERGSVCVREREREIECVYFQFLIFFPRHIEKTKPIRGFQVE